MSKQTGLGDALYVGGYDISGDIGSLANVGCPIATLDATDITESAMDRLFGLRDGAIAFTSYFDPASNMSHDRLGNLPRTDQLVTYCRGTTLGNNAACLTAKQVNYDGKRGDDGSFTFETETLGSLYGLDWGTLLTAGKTTHASAANTTSVDFGTGTTNFGLQAYLHVFSVGSGTCTLTIQESSDNGVGDPFTAVTGGAFTGATGITTQRLATSRTQAVERYLRVASSGVFTNCVFCIVVNRNKQSVVF